MLISFRKKFIFAHIPHTGGTSIRYALKNHSIEFKRPHPHLTLKQIKDKFPFSLVFKNFYKIIVVRNPWDWQVSAYHYLLNDSNHQYHLEVSRLNGFKEFVFCSLKNEFYLQKNFMFDGDKLLADKIIKFENLNEEMTRFFKKFDINTNLLHLNKSKRKDYREYYDEQTKKIFQDAYKEDITMFDYSY